MTANWDIHSCTNVVHTAAGCALIANTMSSFSPSLTVYLSTPRCTCWQWHNRACTSVQEVQSFPHLHTWNSVLSWSVWQLLVPVLPQLCQALPPTCGGGTQCQATTAATGWTAHGSTLQPAGLAHLQQLQLSSQMTLAGSPQPPPTGQLQRGLQAPAEQLIQGCSAGGGWHWRVGFSSSANWTGSTSLLRGRRPFRQLPRPHPPPSLSLQCHGHASTSGGGTHDSSHLSGLAFQLKQHPVLLSWHPGAVQSCTSSLRHSALHGRETEGAADQVREDGSLWLLQNKELRDAGKWQTTSCEGVGQMGPFHTSLICARQHPY